ncbi:SH3 domain-containing protein [Henriciella mobilis]|mgnify:FL=1|uniref:Lipoprotein n=1 Tax=Henriciella mobilis TaxID=2305467 RepID=A0A399RSX7_9PROT|nr:hypothetical protein [Henriciella mobilis]RIJ16043.1 hypothetical protein D1231_09640 [Henriciella mobilis]RIJ23046.1 hypothetical protein D1227_05960 [Henriciella mobilis]RIJ32585.1 hypothetical protein D1223_01650 [Henriciella mobilis]
MRLAILPALALFLAACGGSEPDLPGEDTVAPNPPAEDARVDYEAEGGMIVGGPCSYETDIIEVTVIESDEDGAMVEGPGGEEMYVPSEYVSPVPATGETLTLKVERITEGTCTPLIFSRVE